MKNFYIVKTFYIVVKIKYVPEDYYLSGMDVYEDVYIDKEKAEKALDAVNVDNGVSVAKLFEAEPNDKGKIVKKKLLKEVKK